MDPLPAVSGREEVAETAAHALESFYPVSPTIDLHKTQEYRENVNCTGQVILWPLWPFLHFIKGSFTLSFTSSHPIRFQGRLPLPPRTHSLLPGWSWHQIQAQPRTVSSQNADVHLWERLGSCTHSVRGKKVDAPQRPVAFSCAVRSEKTFCYTVCVCVSDAAPECVRLSHHRPGCGNQREDFPVFGFPAQHHRPDRRPWCEEPGISPMSRTEQRHPVDERLKTSNIFLILPGVAGRRRHALRLC